MEGRTDSKGGGGKREERTNWGIWRRKRKGSHKTVLTVLNSCDVSLITMVLGSVYIYIRSGRTHTVL